MKQVLVMILIIMTTLILSGCSRPLIQRVKVQQNKFHAQILLTLYDKTVSFEVYVYNPPLTLSTVLQSVYVGRVTSFDFTVPHINCVDSIDWHKEMKAGVKQKWAGNIEHDYWDKVIITLR